MDVFAVLVRLRGKQPRHVSACCRRHGDGPMRVECLPLHNDSNHVPRRALRRLDAHASVLAQHGDWRISEAASFSRRPGGLSGIHRLVQQQGKVRSAAERHGGVQPDAVELCRNRSHGDKCSGGGDVCDGQVSFRRRRALCHRGWNAHRGAHSRQLCDTLCDDRHRQHSRAGDRERRRRTRARGMAAS